MKTVKLITGFVFVAFFSTAVWSQTSQKHEMLFEKAKYTMETKGDLKGAIKLFDDLIRKFPKEREYASKAQLRIGICHEKLGESEAQKAYQSVIDNYPLQTAQVAEARARMAELMAKKPSEPSLTHIYSRDNDNFYLEARSLSPDGTKLLGINMTMSPDSGQNVAYKDLTTGKFELITKFDWSSKGHGYTYNPVWSSDGKEVAFNYCGNHSGVWELRVADIKGKSRTIFRGESEGKDKVYPCDWFPEGNSILAIYINSDKQTQLGIIPAQGGEFKLLYEPDVPTDANFQPDARKYFQADLSPDGKHVVFHLAKGDDRNLYILDVASKTVKILADSPANESHPLWSPDGKTIAFLSNRLGNQALWGMSVDKDSNPKGQPFIMNHSMVHATLSNWTAHGINYSNWVEMRDIYTVPVNPETGAPTGKPKQLDFRPTGNNLLPIFSPDGKFIAFVMLPQEGSPGRKVVIYPVSGGKAQIYKIPSKNTWAFLADFRWLPDGSGISFCAETSDETPEWKEGMKPYMLFNLDLETGEWRTQALDGGGYHRCEWRGDGKGYYYTKRMPTGKCHIAERDLQTGKERILFDIPSGMVSLKCSNDYNKLAVSSRQNGIEIIDTKTGKKLKEFKKAGLSAWSPDGRSIMARKSNNLSYHVISYADGSSKEYDLSENLPKGDRLNIDWSPLGDQIALSFRFSQFDGYILHNVIPAEKK